MSLNMLFLNHKTTTTMQQIGLFSKQYNPPPPQAQHILHCIIIFFYLCIVIGFLQYKELKEM